MNAPPGLILAAPASAAGKTTVTLGVLRALAQDGVRVAPFKSGPDFIDPAFHRAASGRESFNLDNWAMEQARLAVLLDSARDAELIVVEAAVGLFDGAPETGASGDGSAAALAALTGWPVVLVLDCAASARSIGAAALGCARLRPQVRVAGAILNRLASDRHERYARAGLEEAGIAALGALRRLPGAALPARHLGLVQAQETPALEAVLDLLAQAVRGGVDLHGLRALARPARDLGAHAAPPPPPGQRIALARDAAFSFIYPHLLHGWRAAGAEILFFSPLADEVPPGRADCCLLPGGYPELHGGALSNARRFMSGLRAFARTRPVHGECGGYMALGAGLEDATGARWEMAGLLGLESSFKDRRLSLGYRHAALLAPALGLAAGARVRGHEFHYCRTLSCEDPPLYNALDAQGAPGAERGARRGHVTGGFLHMVEAASC